MVEAVGVGWYDLGDPAHQAVMAWDRLHIYTEAARYQFDRQRQLFEELAAESAAHRYDLDIEIVRDHLRRWHQAAVDLHFYLDCFHLVGQFMQVIVKAAPQGHFNDTTAVFARYKKKLNEYALARHIFEHVDDYFPGGKYADLGRALIGPGWTPARIVTGPTGKSWDVGPPSLELLEQAVWDFSEIFAAEARAFHALMQIQRHGGG